MPESQQLVSARELVTMNKAHFPNESAQYRNARNALLAEEIELRRDIERVAAQRRALPSGGEIPIDFQFSGENGPVRLSNLFQNEKDTLFLYSMMYGPAVRARISVLLIPVARTGANST